jgi:putative glycerol-1-phosphate prenyltransferase
MKMNVYQSLLEKKKNGEKSFAILIDPDKVSTASLTTLVDLAIAAKADYFLVGGKMLWQTTKIFFHNQIKKV